MSLKRHFLKNFLTDFSEILVEDVKLMLEKVLKVSRRYLPQFFLATERKSAEGNGGRICPQQGAG